jgi:hypothetical protein
MPDERLLALAESGQLHDPQILHAQVRRMLMDPRAHSLATNFGGQWLQTRNLQFQTPDKKAFPEYDVELRDDMRTETICSSSRSSVKIAASSTSWTEDLPS